MEKLSPHADGQEKTQDTPPSPPPAQPQPPNMMQSVLERHERIANRLKGGK